MQFNEKCQPVEYAKSQGPWNIGGSAGVLVIGALVLLRAIPAGQLKERTRV
ncbi:MAG: hypothetical protein ACRESJ_27865 [Pseudomonas sp.]|uniref:hypothetical protein n=1 Tax=Pseudomonas sp. TaxID=306 RepID=UPI003D6FDE37